MEIVNDHKKSRETRKKYFDVNDNFKLLYDLEFPDLIKFNATLPRTDDSNISMIAFHHFSLKKFEKFMKSVNDSIEIAKGIPAKLKKEISENDEKIKYGIAILTHQLFINIRKITYFINQLYEA